MLNFHQPFTQIVCVLYLSKKTVEGFVRAISDFIQGTYSLCFSAR